MATLDPQRVKEFLSRRRPAVNWDDNIDPLAEMFSAAESQEPQVSSPSRRVILPQQEQADEVAPVDSAPPQEEPEDPIRAYVKRRLGSLNQATNAPQVNPDMERNARLQPALANFAGAIDQLGGAAPKAWVSSDVASRDLGQRQDMAEFLARRVKDKDILAGKMADIQSGTGRQAYNQAELARRVKADADRAQAAEDKRIADAATLDKKLEAKRLEDEAKTRRAGVAAGVKKQETERKEAAGVKNAEIPFEDGHFAMRKGFAPVGAQENKLRDLTAAANGASAGLKRLYVATEKALSNPADRSARADVESAAEMVATTLNSAQGQGAMSGGEGDRVKQSIGNTSKPGYWIDVIERAVSGDETPAAILQRIKTAQGTLRDITTGRAKSYNMEFVSDGPATSGSWQVGEVRTGKNGQKLRKRADGKFEVVK